MTDTIRTKGLSAIMVILRVYVGWAWLSAGWGKVKNPAWMETGMAPLGFWKAAVVVPETGKAPIHYDWYRNFLTTLIDGGYHVTFGKLVAIGEVLVGIALIAGGVTIFAAAMGVLMNWAFLMAGTASTNGMMMALSFLIIMSGVCAGYYGLDYWIRPAYRRFMDTYVWKKVVPEPKVAMKAKGVTA